MSNPARYDALVIGAGMSGLAAGIRLAQFDKKVAILERHTLWGGLNSFYKSGGKRFDTGLHALTNYVPKGVKTTPLPKLLRQLRIAYDELALAEQTWSEIAFPSFKLRFANQFGLLEDDVARAFPSERDGFARLVQAVRDTDPFDAEIPVVSGRAMLASFLKDELLIDALLVPLCYYGSAREDDIDWDQLVILFRSLFFEGFAHPEGGIKPLLDLLVRRFKSVGGELRMRAGVQRLLLARDGSARGVVLDDGTELEADCIFSSAGYVETMKLAGQPTERADEGGFSFVESQRVLNGTSASLGHRATITFFCASERFAYRKPAGLIDPTSGVICASDNYAHRDAPVHGLMRFTALANPDAWVRLDETEYRAAKVASEAALLDVAAHFAPDPRAHTLQQDMFTPRTIAHYTGHVNGSVYGSPTKRRTGDSGVRNLHLIGTDQGLLGIVGALLSGVSMANRHALVAS